MTNAPFAVVIIGTLALTSSYTQAGTIRGYVVDASGQRARGATVEAWHDVPTDQRPPQHSTRLSQTTTDARGAFVILVSARDVNLLIASFDHQSGAARPSFTAEVRIALRRNRPRPHLTNR
jgi:hypothetical protein